MSNHLANYNMTAWPKAAGPRVTEAQLATAHAFGRPGKQTLAVAMRLREKGATAGEVLAAVEALFNVPGGRPQNNFSKALVAAGYFSRDPATMLRDGATCYRFTLAPKGQSFIDGHGVKAQGKASDKGKATAKAARKPRAAKAPAKPEAAVEAVTAPEAAPANEPAQ